MSETKFGREIEITDESIKKMVRNRLVLPYDDNTGLIVLIRGKPGTGKSTLGLQLLHGMKTDAPRKYFSMEQTWIDLQAKFVSMAVARAFSASLRLNGASFCCDKEVLAKSLKDESLPVDIDSVLAEELKGFGIPREKEPSPEVSESDRKIRETLCSLIIKSCFGNPATYRAIEFSDERVENKECRSIGGASSRILSTLQFLENKAPVPAEDSPRSSRPVIAVDGLSLLSSSEREAMEVQNIIALMRERLQVGILIYEPNEGESMSLDHHADLVIDLARRNLERPLPYLIHEICFRKARYQDPALGNHQFKIRSWGLEIFPSLHFQIHHYNFMDLEHKRSSELSLSKFPQSAETSGGPALPAAPMPTGGASASVNEAALPGKDAQVEEGSVLDLLCNPRPGEIIVLLGSRNTFKTELTMDFLVRGTMKPPPPSGGDRGLLLSLIDTPESMQRMTRCPWKQGEKQCRAGHECCFHETSPLDRIYPLSQRPGCITASEFFHFVQKRLDPDGTGEPSVQRLAFWDLTQMDYRFPFFREDRMLLPALMDKFRTLKLKSVIMGAGNAENTKAASAMADHALFCWRSDHKYTRGEDKGRPYWKVYDKNAAESNKGDPIDALMIYVDRTSSSTQLEGHALFVFPIEKSGRSEELKLPKDRGDLLKSFTLDVRDAGPRDRRHIHTIMKMQGVE